MKTGGRLCAAIEILTDIETNHRPVSEALKDWGTKHRFAGSGDRAAIGNLVYDSLRKRSSIGWRMGAENPRALVLGTYVWTWGQGLAGLDAALAEPHAPAPLSDDERTRLGTDDGLADAPDPVRGDYPAWLETAFLRVFGDDAAAEGAALATRAPVDLRANALKSTRDKALKALAETGAVAGRLSPVAIRVPVPGGPGRAPHIESEPAYLKGHVEIQDEGSQIAALVAAAFGGSQILDLCAGGGGKTLALAVQGLPAADPTRVAAPSPAGWSPTGADEVAAARSAPAAVPMRLIACDVVQKRLDNIRPRLSRAGVAADLRLIGQNGGGVEEFNGKADLVFVDAPCSGSGAWRRRPEDAWRLKADEIERLHALQLRILGQAAALVKPGGRLVYVTCSVLARENEAVADAFEGAHKGFQPLSVADVLAAPTLTDAARTRLAGAAAGGRLRLSPASTGTDGFFVALYERRA